MLTVNQRLFFMFSLTLLILWVRLVPHQAETVPVIALFLLLGFVSTHWILGSVLGLTAYLISDLYLGIYPGWFMNYLAFFALILIGQSFKFHWLSAIKNTLLASFIFFVISNLGVFLFSGLYPHTISGFYQCYLMAVPFFRTTLISNGVFLLAMTAIVQTYIFVQQKKEQELF